MMKTRRSFLQSLPALAFYPAPLGTSLAANAQSVAKDAVRLDALCYSYYREITGERIARVIAGGLTVAVFDINAIPRNYRTALSELRKWQARFNAPASRALAIRQAADVRHAQRVKKLGIVLACQDAAILGDKLDDGLKKLREFYDLGLRVLQLTHNEPNAWGTSYQENRRTGLSEAGRGLIKKMNELGIAIDLSHCNPQTLYDTLALSQRPCLVTHAGCRALANTSRNKSDDELRALGKSGGFFGVYNMTNWLTAHPTATLDIVIDHIAYAAKLIGAERVGFGSDGALDALDAASETNSMANMQRASQGKPGAEWVVRHVRVPELNAPNRMEKLAAGLTRRGFKTAEIEGFLGGNFIRVFQQVCG